MGHTTKTFYTLDELSCHLKLHRPGFYFSSKTSTVIPYDKIGQLLGDQKDLDLCDLSKLPSHMELLESGNIIIKGGVSWDEAKKFLKSKGRNLKTSPTEQLALITAGVATSCTGERCFGFGNMRSQVVGLKYLNYLGEEKSLSKFNKLHFDSPYLGPYQQEFSICPSRHLIDKSLAGKILPYGSKSVDHFLLYEKPNSTESTETSTQEPYMKILPF